MHAVSLRYSSNRCPNDRAMKISAFFVRDLCCPNGLRYNEGQLDHPNCKGHEDNLHCEINQRTKSKTDKSKRNSQSQKLLGDSPQSSK